MRNNLESDEEHWVFLEEMKTEIVAKRITQITIYLNVPNSNTGRNDWSVFTVIDMGCSYTIPLGCADQSWQDKSKAVSF